RIGEEPIDLLRAVGNKPAAQQATALEELKTERTKGEGRQGQTNPSGRNGQRQERPQRDRSGDYDVITSLPQAD
ncbi:plasmid partitioning protein, partial [Streptomyces flaveolus]